MWKIRDITTNSISVHTVWLIGRDYYAKSYATNFPINNEETHLLATSSEGSKKKHQKIFTLNNWDKLKIV